MDKAAIALLEDKAREIRLNIVKMIGAGRVAHIGGSCSLADIAAALFFYKMKHDPQNPEMPDRDKFVLSKGHAVPVQYTCLAMCGYFPLDTLPTLKTLGSPLQGHPDKTKLPYLEANSGSLGQGLSIAAGLAAAIKLDGLGANVYCVVGDGELAEGQIWEAAMSAAVYRLDNLTVFVDRNGLQATGYTKDRFPIGPIREKWQAFGWNVVEIDGHNMEQIVDTLDQVDHSCGRPTCIIANTVKGKGIPFAEDVCRYHNGQFTQEEYEAAIQGLSK